MSAREMAAALATGNLWTVLTVLAVVFVLVRIACACNGMDRSTPHSVRHALVVLLVGAGTYAIAPSWGHRFDWLDFIFAASVAAAIWADRRHRHHHRNHPGELT